MQNGGSEAGKRKARRDRMLLKGSLRSVTGGRDYPVLIRNLSSGGMMVEGHPQLVTSELVEGEVAGLGEVRGIVAWTEAGRAGIAFAAPVDPDRARVVPEPAPQPHVKVQPVKSMRRPGVRRIED